MKINLTSAPLAGFMIGLLDEKAPELRVLFDAAKEASRLESHATAARAKATEGREQAGADNESLFKKAISAAVKLAFVDNGPGNEPGIAGITVLQYFEGRIAAEGLNENTGKAMARLTAQTVEALRLGYVDRDTVENWTRPDAQEFFASEDAQARSAVKRQVGDMLKGCVKDYADQLHAHIASFRYERPEGANWAADGYHPKKEKTQAKPAPDA